MLTLYDYLPSQNAYKIRLLLSHMGQPYRTQMVSIFEGEGQNEAFRRVSPTGAVPAIELEDGRCLAESNAILMFLADGTRYLPSDAFGRAKVMQWLCFESDYVQAGIATLRHWILTGKDRNRPSALLEMKRDQSLRTLGILERQLGNGGFIAGSGYTVADMSLFAYVHLAGDAGLSLDDFPKVTTWIERVRGEEGFLSEMYDYSIDPFSAREL